VSGAAAHDALEPGVRAFRGRDLLAAHHHFERAHRADPREPRAMSWYGVTLVLVERNMTLGTSFCDQALRGAPTDPELLLNLARVQLALNQRVRASKAIARGLQAWPEHPGLRLARDEMGTRRAPVVPFLSRDNPLNRLLGRLRHRWTTGVRSPRRDLSPETLGFPAAPDATPGAE
jgi:hypothetical protein